MIVTEQVIATAPFTVRRRVRFGDCDPAGVAYTARFSEFVISAMDLFFQELLGAPFGTRFPGIDTPLKALSFAFHAPLRPNDDIEMVVTSGEVRTSTFQLLVAARLPEGTPAFDAILTPICIAPDERRRVDIPPLLRTVLENHQRTGATHGTTLPH